ARRPVRRRADTRPELPLARAAQDRRRPAVARRREHASRPRTRRRLRRARRAAAAEEATVTPRVSISQITTFTASFADDVRLYAAAGLDGIGIWELKLAGDSLELFEASGLESASAIPDVPSILPLPLLGGPTDPAERVEAVCASLERLAPFRPSGVVCLTGTALGRDPEEARTI